MARVPRRRQPAACAAEAARLQAMLSFEQDLYAAGSTAVAGVDEAGAGPLAGPVFAAAVVLPPGCSLAGINDSKKLSAAMRQQLAAVIMRRARSYAVAQASAAEVDALNIRQACLLAMRRAVAQLPELGQPGLHVLVDAHRLHPLAAPQTALIRGDSRSQSIAAASILAKTQRDAAMVAYDVLYPGYGFATHKGYGTAAHLAALARLGPCPLHRRTYAPVRQHLSAGAPPPRTAALG